MSGFAPDPGQLGLPPDLLCPACDRGVHFISRLPGEDGNVDRLQCRVCVHIWDDPASAGTPMFSVVVTFRDGRAYPACMSADDLDLFIKPMKVDSLITMDLGTGAYRHYPFHELAVIDQTPLSLVMMQAKVESEPPTDEVADDVPLYDYAMERGLLACMMVDDEAIGLARQFVDQDSFHLLANRIVYVAIVALRGRDMVVDVPSVMSAIGDELDEIGGEAYVMQIARSLTASRNAEAIASILSDMHERRLQAMPSTKDGEFLVANRDEVEALVGAAIDEVEGERRGTRRIARLDLESVSLLPDGNLGPRGTVPMPHVPPPKESAVTIDGGRLIVKVARGDA